MGGIAKDVLKSTAHMMCRTRHRRMTGASSRMLEIQATPTDRNEKTTLVTKGPYPSNLRKPPFDAPVVRSAGEQLSRLLSQYCAWERAQVLDVIFSKPSLHLSQSVTVLLGMLILVSQPCVAPVWLTLSIA